MRRHFQRAHEDGGGLSFSASSSIHSARRKPCSMPWTQVFRRRRPRSVTADTEGFPRTSLCRMRRPGLSRSGSRRARRAQGDRRLGRAVRHGERDQPAGEAGAPDCAYRAAAGRRASPVGIERRGARHGDLLVLVRQRGPLFEAIIRALKNEDVAVAGADRLVLTEHIAVMDLMALADALLLPADDLALATVLRSPLFGFSDEDLFAIAWDRGRSRCARRWREGRRAEKICRCRGASRQTCRSGAARVAVRVLRAAARRRRRPAAFPRPARRRGE